MVFNGRIDAEVSPHSGNALCSLRGTRTLLSPPRTRHTKFVHYPCCSVVQDAGYISVDILKETQWLPSLVDTYHPMHYQ